MFYIQKFNKSVSPLIATILLIVVAVVLVALILNWGRDFAQRELDDPSVVYETDDSLVGFVSLSRSSFDNYEIRNNSQQEIVFTKYTIVSDLNNDHGLVNKPLSFKEPISLSVGGGALIDFICYPSNEFTINLITDDNTYVSLRVSNVKLTEIEPNGCKTDLVGQGTEEVPYRIYNVFQLNKIRNHLDSFFVLEKDVDFDSIDLTEFNDFEDYDETGWLAIGDFDESPFTGVFDGQENTINNLFVNESTSFQGLFAFTKDANISNLILKDVNVTGHFYVGGLVGGLQSRKNKKLFCYRESKRPF